MRRFVPRRAVPAGSETAPEGGRSGADTAAGDRSTRWRLGDGFRRALRRHRASAALVHALMFLLVSALAGVLVAGLALPVAGSVGLAARGGAESFQSLSGELEAGALPVNSKVIAEDGTLLATFYDQNRVLVPLKDIAPVMRQALIAIEDSRFYEHGGIDLRGTTRALVSNSSGEQTQGGSTITQQYVKNVLVESALDRGDEEAARAAKDRTGPGGYQRKLRELRYAVALEQELSKDQILERYLNIAYFGNGTYGVEAASRRYFDKHASNLLPREAALLAGMVKNPTAYDPLKRPKLSLERRNVVLARMAEVGVLSPAAAASARAEKLKLEPGGDQSGCISTVAPFFCDYVKRSILQDSFFGTPEQRFRLLFRGGMTIQTTLSMPAQRAAQKALATRIYAKDKVAGAVVGIEPGTGQIKSMALTRGYGQKKGKTELNFAVDQSMGGGGGVQAGSTFKAFTAAEALRQGYGLDYKILAPKRVTEVKPIRTCTGLKTLAADEQDYRPGNPRRNSNRVFDLPGAMAQSVNTHFFELQQKVGLCELITRTERMGVRQANGKPLEETFGWTLGANDVSPLRMAEAYATFAARGTHCTPIAITKITDRNGASIPVPKTKCEQVMDPAVADATTYALKAVLATGGTAARSRLNRPAAGKTGTTDNLVAVWFVGYTPSLSTAVAAWNPFPGNEFYRLENRVIGGRFYARPHGSSISAPIWKEAMEGALEGKPKTDFRAPEQRFFAGTQGPGYVPPPPVFTPPPGGIILPGASPSPGATTPPPPSATPSPRPGPTTPPPSPRPSPRPSKTPGGPPSPRP